MDLPLLLSLTVVLPLLILVLAGASVFFLFLRRRCRPSNFTAPGDIERSGGGKIADVPDEDSADRRFTWSELESFTCGFTSKLVGEGGYSAVYLAELSGGGAAAVKVYRSASERLRRAFRQELDLLLRLRHPHLVVLLGFCDEREGALVLEYVAGGNLHDKLHSVDVNSPVMTWTRRTTVAYQLAKALEYLHETCNPFVVHGDIKSANVLLDANANVVKLCDFGSASIGFSAIVRQPAAAAPVMTGSLGYVDPHYLRTGVLSKKSDVYSFGVLLMELITGLEAFSEEKRRPLAAVVRETVKFDQLNYREFVDNKMEGKYDTGEAAELVALAAKCVGEQPGMRPSMAEVVRVMEEKIAGVSSQNK